MERRYDALVIGAGVAGLRAAIALGELGARVAVATKEIPQLSTSSQAKGGIAVALSGEEEDLDLHEEDTLKAGAGLCDPERVRTLVRDGRDEVLRLIDWGARFDREGPFYHLAREGAHSLPRILHAGGDATGREIVRVLVEVVKRMPVVTRLAGALVTDVLRAGERCAGARMLMADGAVVDVMAGAVVLATGGSGQAWGTTSNPREATGDGVAIAARAGCVLGDMEFMQFHPTALALEGAPPVLLTEALRGEGAIVRNAAGRRFLFEEDVRGELAPRDIVARGIAREIARGGGGPVLLDVTGMPRERLEHRFPNVLEACRRFGLDPLVDPIPARPAMHYAMGGVVTDEDGRTGLRGLVAAGEVASAGVHGANRLASNSLLEGLVFGARAARGLVSDGLAGSDPGRADDPRPGTPDPAHAGALLDELQRRADADLGILRHGTRLGAMATFCDEQAAALGAGGVPTREAVEAASALYVLRAVAHAAAWREESRGAHFREDFPARDDARFTVHSRQRLDGAVWSDPVGE